MADNYDLGKSTRKKIHKKFEKDSEGFYSENYRSMRTPVNLYETKPISTYKGFHNTSSNNEDSYSLGFWEPKRGGRRFQSDGSDYRSGYGQRFKHQDSKDFYKQDTGQPPGEEDSSAAENVPMTPVILTRERTTSEGKGVTKSSTPSTQSKDEELADESKPNVSVVTPAKQYHIASKPNANETSIVPVEVMSASIKMIDESLSLGEDLAPYLLDQSYFLVLGVVGMQGAGKSTIASLLAEPTKAQNCTKSRFLLFNPESRDEILRGCHATSGIDVFITKERVIILDLQPLLSPSVMDYAPNIEKKVSLDFINSPEHLMEIESLQLLTFAMTVCHALVVVQDSSSMTNMVRMLHTCQMMKPHSNANASTLSSSTGRSSTDNEHYFPHLVIVQNFAAKWDFSPKSVEELQALYQTYLYDSSLCHDSQIGICNGTKPPLSNRGAGGNVNLFLIPDIHSNGNASFVESIVEMRRQIFSLSRCPLTHVTLTEKSWYTYACRIWESLRKSNLFAEYSRLLP